MEDSRPCRFWPVRIPDRRFLGSFGPAISARTINDENRITLSIFLHCITLELFRNALSTRLLKRYYTRCTEQNFLRAGRPMRRRLKIRLR